MRKRILIGLGVFVLALAAAWVIADVRSTAALEASIERIRAAGDPVTFEELMETAKPATPGVGAEGRVADFFYGDLADTGRKVSQSNFADVGENLVWDDGDFAVEIEKVWEEWSPEIEADARKVVEANRAFLDRIHELVSLPLEEPGVMLHRSGQDKSSVMDVRLPHLASVRGVSGLLSLETALAAKSGDEPGTARSLVHEFRWTRHMGSANDMLIGASFTQSMQAIVAKTVMRAVQSVPFSPESAQALDEELSAIAVYDRLVTALQMERVFWLDWYFQERSRHSDSGEQDSERPALSGLTSRLFRFLVHHDHNTGLEIYEELLPCAAENYKEFQVCQAELNEQFAQLGWTELMTSIMLPNLLRSRMQVDDTQALISLARIALALNRFHADTGTYPASLDELAPTYIEPVPLDVFTQAPFPYQREGSGYVMYSVGAPDGHHKGPDSFLSVRVM